jgi:hypothetical protein
MSSRIESDTNGIELFGPIATRKHASKASPGDIKCSHLFGLGSTSLFRLKLCVRFTKQNKTQQNKTKQNKNY